jgi:hypothetical protein
MKNITHKEITSSTIKKEVLTYFFDRINYYEYRYIILKTIGDLQKNEKNIEYVIPHIKGDPYFLIFGTFNRKSCSYLIEKKKLKFNLDQCNVDEIKIMSGNYQAVSKTYIGSIFDGRIIPTNNIFLIQDCYYLDGTRMNAWKLEKKLNYLDEYISKNMNNQNIKIRKVDNISEIVELDNKISKSTVEINGFIFLQARSGISYIFIDNDNFQNNKIIKEQVSSSVPIIVPTISLNITSNLETNIFIVKKDAKPDVYHIYDNDNLIHFASIPDTFTSQLVFDALKNSDFAKFKCIMCPKWKRYKPVELVS